MAQEITNTCGMPNVDLSTIHQQFTLPENTKIDNLTHPCGSTGTVNLRVVVHFMLKSDGTGNFNEFNDGRVNDPRPAGSPLDYHYRWNGYRFAAELIHAANTILLHNDTLGRVPGSTCSPIPTPKPTVFAKRILYTLQGVYFHRKNNVANDYLSMSVPFTYDSTYAVKKDSCIQIYLFPNVGAGIPSGYVQHVLGADNKMACFMTNLWDSYLQTSYHHWNEFIWSYGFALHKTLNHEIMHLLGLHHTDGSPYVGLLTHLDLCYDTPECGHKAGLNTMVNDGLCSTCVMILTPDQLSRVYTTLSGGYLWTSGPAHAKSYTNTAYATKYIYQCNSCAPVGSPPYSFFHLNKNGCGEVFMGGGWYGTWFTYANQFIEIYETNAVGSTTVTGPYYSGWRAADEFSYLRNLSSLYTFQNGKIYRIKMAVNSSCVGWHESVQYLVYTNPTPCERVASNDIQTPVSQVYPNPVLDKANLTFTHPTQHIQVVDAMGRLVDTFVAENPHFTVWQPNINLPNGLYFIVSDNRQNSIIKVIVQR